MITSAPTLNDSTKLRRPWLHLARAGWIVVAVCCVVLFIDGTRNTLRQPLPSCTTPGIACPASTQVSREDVAIADEMGLRVPLLPLALATSVLARLSMASVGILIFWRRSDDWVAIAVSAALITVLLEGAQGHSAGLERLLPVLLAVGTALFVPIPFIFPTGRFVPQWTRLPVLLLTAVYATVVITTTHSPYYGLLTAIVSFIWVGLALIAMPYRYFRVAGPLERQQIKWVLLGIGTVFVPGTLWPVYNALYPPSQPSTARVMMMLAIMPFYVGGYGFFALSIVMAMLRYRLWDVDVIIRKTVQYTLVSALLALVYFGTVVLLQGVFDTVVGESPLLIVASTLLIAALFNPVRRRVQDAVDRRFYRRKYDAQQVLAQFAQTCRDETDVGRLSAELTAVIQETLEPQMVTVWLRK